MATIRFFGLLQMTPLERTAAFDWQHVETATALRNGGTRAVARMLAAIEDADFREEVGHSWQHRTSLQQVRNRVIHDVIEVGIFGDDREGWEAKPLLGPNLLDRSFDPYGGFWQIKPESVAELACMAHELALDFDGYAYRLPKEELPDDGPISDTEQEEPSGNHSGDEHDRT